MNRNLKLIKNHLKHFTTKKQSKDLKFDYFEYKGEKFSDKENWFGLSREEVLGTSQIGYDSFRYEKENSKLKFNVFVIAGISMAYIYSYWCVCKSVNEACGVYVNENNKRNQFYSVVG